jgi:hypothetical protein
LAASLLVSKMSSFGKPALDLLADHLAQQLAGAFSKNLRHRILDLGDWQYNLVSVHGVAESDRGTTAGAEKQR